MLDPRHAGFRPLTMEDLPLIHRWLNHTPIVKDVYAHGEETPYEKVVAKYGARIRGEVPTSAWALTYAGTPIGYIQHYLWRDYPGYIQYSDAFVDAAGLDMFIGEPEYVYRGLGTPLIQAFFKQVVFTGNDAKNCVIVPEVRNTSALRAYEKAGFINLGVIHPPEEPGPICILRIRREEALA